MAILAAWTALESFAGRGLTKMQQPDRFAPLAKRLEFGRKRRKGVPRLGHGQWKPARDRADTIDLLRAANKGRVASLLPIKYSRMADSPFGFFRGAAALMAGDLAAQPHTGILVQLCGDAHVLNVGAFAAPDGRLMFDINDFDEAIRGPWEWDLKRLATSFVLAGREAGARDSFCGEAVDILVRTYQQAIAEFAPMPALELFRHPIGRLPGSISAILRQAEHEKPLKSLERLTQKDRSGRRSFKNRPPLLTPVAGATAKKVIAALDPYRNTVSDDRQILIDAYRPKCVGFKVVGTGSIGTRDYVVLLEGQGPKDPLFLQVKQELVSCWAPHTKNNGRRINQGRRVAQAQHRTQTLSDPCLGWTAIDGDDYLVRQLADHKAGIDPAQLKGSALLEYAEVCGQLFARAHARTSDPAAIAGYCGVSDRLSKGLRRFAFAYAKQTAADHEALQRAIRNKKVTAVRAS